MTNLVSIIIPVYNGENFIKSSIETIKKQNYDLTEIIFIDDGSTDKTAKIISEYQEENIKYIYQKNKGPASARNQGLKIAQGDFITFLDIDDLWAENKLENQVQYLQQNPSIDIVQGLIQKVKIDNSSTMINSNIIPLTKPYHFVNLGSCLCRKSVFEKIGYFNEDMRYGEDVDFFFRAWENNLSKVVIQEICLYYCQHESNMTKGKNYVELGLLRVFHQHNLRQRKEGKILTNSQIKIRDYLGVSP